MSRFSGKKAVTPAVTSTTKDKPFLIRSDGEIKKLKEGDACIYQTLRDQESPEDIDAVYENARSTLGGQNIEYDDDIVLHKLATQTYGYTGPTAYTASEFGTFLSEFKNATGAPTRLLVAATKQQSLASKLADGKEAFQNAFTGGTLDGEWHVFGFHRTKKGKADCFDQQYNNKETVGGYKVFLVWGRGDR